MKFLHVSSFVFFKKSINQYTVINYTSSSTVHRPQAFWRAPLSLSLYKLGRTTPKSIN